MLNTEYILVVEGHFEHLNVYKCNENWALLLYGENSWGKILGKQTNTVL
jgi:hypothetical protein